MKDFDFIIVGGGASGLLLADAMGADPWFGESRILLLEKFRRKGNDRTWCFWESGPGRFDPLLYRQWDHIIFKGPDLNKRLPIDPFRYKMIRGADFYREYYPRIEAHPNIEIRYEAVRDIEESETHARVHTAAGHYDAPLVFSSVSFRPREELMRPFPVLQQHFKGWFVRSEHPVFDAEAPTFMDFSIAQKGNTRFMYILPFSPHEALVEYTLFSKDRLEEQQYDTAVEAYLRDDLGISDYQVLETEKGSIPMTVNDFSAADSDHLVHIGIAGGWAKPSTGYTFWNTSQKVSKLVAALKAGKSLKMATKNKFWYYDRLLLDVLACDNDKGSLIFSMLFRHLPPQHIFRFLHEQTSFAQDFKVINSSPKGMFIRAFWRALTRSSC